MNETNNQAQVTPSVETTQPVKTPAEEKVTTEPVTQNETSNESPLESSTTEVKPEEGITNTPQETTEVKSEPELSDDVKQKLERLKEYEVQEKELQDLKSRLGDKAPSDNVTFEAQRRLAMFENQKQQEYIQLCNQYGVDFNPDKIDESAKALLDRDPKGYYELDYKLRALNDEVTNARNQVNGFIEQRDMNVALKRNEAVLQASPAINSVVQTLVKQGTVTGGDIDNIVNFATQVAREAFEMGRNSVAQAKPSPAEVLNNNAISQTSPVNGPSEPKFTREDIARMDLQTYEKNKALIDKLAREGKI